MDNKHKSISYAKWGYIFIAPFIIVFILCQLIPLFSTFYNSFFENYMDGLDPISLDLITTLSCLPLPATEKSVS